MHSGVESIECLIEKYVIWDTPELFNKEKTWLNYIHLQGKVPFVIKVKPESAGLASMKQRLNTLTLHPSSSTVKQSCLLMNNSLRREIPVTQTV